MKAYLVGKYKRPMHVGEVAEPAIDDRDVLVEVHAAGVNMLDAKIRDGEFKLVLPYKAPFILGHDLAGVVARVGSAVARTSCGGPVRPRGVRRRGSFQRNSSARLTKSSWNWNTPPCPASG
jgi:NADPH:quinone reductase-like Zn-dependent oxidoreductase